MCGFSFLFLFTKPVSLAILFKKFAERYFSESWVKELLKLDIKSFTSIKSAFFL
jgi:hypothetical protein